MSKTRYLILVLVLVSINLSSYALNLSLFGYVEDNE